MKRPFRTVFIHRRTQIPDDIRRRNVRALSSVAARMTVQRPGVSQDFRHQAALWAHCDTTFAAFDVMAADPLVADMDERPFRWQRLLMPTVVPGSSAMGMLAEMR